MRERCNNKNSEDYRYYGKRGIKVCDEWNDSKAFCEWADNNGFDGILTIHRKNNDLGYSPDNCIFANQITQQNEKTNNRFIEINGETKTVANWGRDEKCTVPTQTIRARLYNGWDEHDAILTPIGIKSTQTLKKIEEEYQQEVGKTYGRLTIKKVYSEKKYGQNITYCKVVCKCGNDFPKDRKLTELKTHKGIASCGCATRELSSERMKAQNQSGGITTNPLYGRWNTALVRCKESRISIATEWQNFSNYHDWCLRNGWQDGYRVSLIDTKKEFGPNNCIVKPPKEEDDRNSNILLTAFGETKTITDWLKDSRCKNGYGTIRSRFYKGELSHEDIISKKPRVLDKSNQSGIEGISWVSSRNKWNVNKQIDGKTKRIGQYKTIEEAKFALENN